VENKESILSNIFNHLLFNDEEEFIIDDYKSTDNSFSSELVNIIKLIIDDIVERNSYPILDNADIMPRPFDIRIGPLSILKEYLLILEPLNIKVVLRDIKGLINSVSDDIIIKESTKDCLNTISLMKKYFNIDIKLFLEKCKDTNIYKITKLIKSL
jgi:hypothetical protein